ncbi:MAG: hypothetical protein ACLSG9_09345 [Eubacterium sp.]
MEKGYDRIYFYQREQKQETAAQMTCRPGDVHKIGIKDVIYEVSFTLKKSFGTAGENSAKGLYEMV